ncbi:MAG: hypothetical protein VX663_06375, partial [Pseudomonadota bacterium]|nr:hypothetical protein [Pseudomonadota bacterium]
NPWQLSPQEGRDVSFVRDLGVDQLLGGIPFLGSDTRELALFVFAHLPEDTTTVRYRQDVFADLLARDRLRSDLRGAVRSLLLIDRKSREFEWGQNLQTGLQLLRAYRRFIELPLDVAGVSSEALCSLADYLETVRGSSEFAGLCRFIERIESLGGVAFHVSLDDEGQPERMFTLRLLDGSENRGLSPELEQLLGPRLYERLPEAGDGSLGLKEPWGLTELGKLIQEFVSQQFVAAIAGFNEQIRAVVELLGPLDLYTAFAEFFHGLAGRGLPVCRPRIAEPGVRTLDVKGACNPLLAGRTAAEAVVPNDILQSPRTNLFVLTGANNGGKTTFVKTVGLIQLLAQKGLPVTAEQAQVSLADGIYTHFVAPDDITKGEGRYRNELRRIRQILERATPFSLVILDEPCGGTDHQEGQRQSLVLLRGFHTLGAATYFTTHMHEVAAAVEAGEFPGAANLRVECRREAGTLRYSYRILPGAAGRSYGEEIALEMGLVEQEVLGIIRARATEEGYQELLRSTGAGMSKEVDSA